MVGRGRLYKGIQLHVDGGQVIRLTRSVSGEADVGFVHVIPPVVTDDDQTLMPARMVR